jgi:hypothetical protein
MSSQIKNKRLGAIDAFIKVAQDLKYKASPFENYPAYPEGKTYHEYIQWNKEIREYFAKEHLIVYLHSDFFAGEQISLPSETKTLTNTDLSPSSFELYPDRSASRTFRKMMCDALQYQITNLGRVKTVLVEDSEPIEINVEKDGLVWRDPKTEFYHQGKPNSKRVKFLRLFLHQLVSIKSSVLMRKLHYKDAQLLSKEKRGLNSVLQKNLELPEAVILGGDGRRGSGYHLNPKYKLKVS